MKILLLTAHSIAEYDDLQMLHRLGHEVLSIGAYLDPAHPQDDKRPALPQVPAQSEELRTAVADQMAAKSDLPQSVIEWADTVICHHFPAGAPDGLPGWITGPNWRKWKEQGTRVIWRTCGQSNHYLESIMAHYVSSGLEVIRYSPKERNLPNFAGEDALIRFGKDPADWYGWTGEEAVVGNVTQNMGERGDACGYWFWQAATDGLQALPAGPGSDRIGGVGELTYNEMRAYLRRCRAYLYTGTQPASYTLGLIEAMMTGVPVVSIGPKAFGQGSYLEDLFEGHELTLNGADDPQEAKAVLQAYLADKNDCITFQRQRAIDLFGINAISEQWRAFL